MERKQILDLAKLAKLSIDENQVEAVTTSISNVLALVDKLQAADLKDIKPMAHPLDAIQRLRTDDISEENVRDAFQKIAPAAEQGLYLVPKVID